MARPRKAPGTRTFNLGISLGPGMDLFIDKKRGDEKRSPWCCDLIAEVLDSDSIKFRPSKADVLLLERCDVQARKKGKAGMPGKEGWTRTRSLSFTPELHERMQQHRELLGIERSRYLTICVEHIHGIRPHPELFEKSMRPE